MSTTISPLLSQGNAVLLVLNKVVGEVKGGGQYIMDRRHTAVLDGIRGFAALAVMNYHIFYLYHSFVFYGYGLPSQLLGKCGRLQDRHSINSWLHQLPVLRLAFSGTAAVSMFFVISGFAVSHRALSYAAAGQPTDSLQALSASSFRRAGRLLIPPCIVTFGTMLAIRAKLFAPGRLIIHDSSMIPVIPERHQERLPTATTQLIHWFSQTWKMCNVFSWADFNHSYDVHLWTIPVELRCSFVLFLVLFATVQLRSSVRLTVLFLSYCYAVAWNRWDVQLFIAGALVAAFDIRISGRDSSFDRPSDHGQHKKSWQMRLRIIAKLTATVLALLLMSTPDFCIEHTPGYSFIGKLIPDFVTSPFRFWPGIGSPILIFVSLQGGSDTIARRLFCTKTSQFLGRISYSLYLVHGPLTHIVGLPLFSWCLGIMGRDSLVNYCVGFLAAYLVLATLIISMAALVYRWIDAPATRIMKVIWEKSLQRSEKF